MSSERFLREHTCLKQIMGSFSIRCLHFCVYQPWWTKYAVLFYNVWRNAVLRRNSSWITNELCFRSLWRCFRDFYPRWWFSSVWDGFIITASLLTFRLLRNHVTLHTRRSETFTRTKEYYWNPYWSASYMSLNKQISQVMDFRCSDLMIPISHPHLWKSKRWCKVSLLCVVVHAGQEVLLFFPFYLCWCLFSSWMSITHLFSAFCVVNEMFKKHQ